MTTNGLQFSIDGSPRARASGDVQVFHDLPDSLELHVKHTREGVVIDLLHREGGEVLESQSFMAGELIDALIQSDWRSSSTNSDSA